MNKEEIKNLKFLKKVSLDDNERNLLRLRLMEYTEYLPIRDGISTQSKPYLSFFSYKHIVGVVFVPLFLIITSGGVLFSAEEALPGDFLYKLKTNVNEEAQGLFVFSLHKKAEHRNTLIEKRIEEAELLAINGMLTSNNKDILSQGINKQVQLLEKDLRTLTVEDESFATTEGLKLSSRIKSYDEVVDVFLPKAATEDVRIIEEHSIATSETLSMASVPADIESVATTTEKKNELREGARSTTTPQEVDVLNILALEEGAERLVSGDRFFNIAQDKRKEMDENLKKITENLLTHKNKIPEAFLARINSQINQIVKLQERAHEEYRNENYKESYVYSQKTIRKLRDVEIQLSRYVISIPVRGVDTL